MGRKDLVDLLETAFPEWQGRIGRIDPVSGGMTNCNYCVWIDESPVFVRQSGETADSLGIRRDDEFVAAGLAGRLGIAPSVRLYNMTHRLLVTDYIFGETLTKERLRSPERLQDVALLLRRAHESEPDVGTFSVFVTIEDYWQRVQHLDPGLLDAHRSKRQWIDAIRQLVPKEPVGLCHNDLLAANFVEETNSHRLWLVDWEYAGLGTPYFDLGNFAANQDLAPEEEEQLAGWYFDTTNTRAHVGLIRILRVASDFREALWGTVQHLLSTMALDFDDYAAMHWQRVERAIADERIQSELNYLQQSHER